MTKRDRNYLIVFLAVVLMFIGYLIIKETKVKAYQYVKQSTSLQDTLPEGNYSGSFKVYNVEFAKVEFLIKNGKINNFKIPRVISVPWRKIRASVKDSVEKKNSLHFDAVTGATGSSLYIKAAIHEAIKKPKK